MGGGDFHPNNLGQRYFYEKAVKPWFEDDRLLEPFVPKPDKKRFNMREYLPTLSELIDRLSICQLKEVKISDKKLNMERKSNK